FFLCYSTHHHLPSFPTRRSSDLVSIFPRQRKQQLRQLPIRTNRAENLVVLHLPGHHRLRHAFLLQQFDGLAQLAEAYPMQPFREDRKSTRLNSSHVSISYAVFCL